MWSSLQLVNAHYQLCLCQPINLQKLNEVMGMNGKLYHGRPKMLSCKILMKRVQFFPSGTIQVLGGGMTPVLLKSLLQKICTLLRRCSMTIPQRKYYWIVNNAVYKFNLFQRFKFEHYNCNQYFSYEPELFPAAMISYWSPGHVTLFPNGKGMITGIKDRDTALSILDKLPTFLTDYAHHCRFLSGADSRMANHFNQ